MDFATVSHWVKYVLGYGTMGLVMLMALVLVAVGLYAILSKSDHS